MGWFNRKKRSDTVKLESGDKDAQASTNEAEGLKKLKPLHGEFTEKEELEEGEDDDQRKHYAEYTNYMLKDVRPDNVPKKPLLAAKWYLQKYTMIAAAVKAAEAKQAEFEKAISIVDEESESEDDSDEDENDSDADERERERNERRARQRSLKLNSSAMARRLAKARPSEQEDLKALKRKAEYAKERAERAYHNLPLRHKVAFKLYSQALRYFGGKPDAFGNPNVSYASLAMSILCLLTFGYCILLQISIIARTINASYIDDSTNGGANAAPGNDSLSSTEYVHTRLTQTEFDPVYATSFRQATRASKAKASKTKTQTKMKSTANAKRTVVASDWTAEIQLITASPTTIASAAGLDYAISTTIPTIEPRLITRKTLKSKNQDRAPANDLSVSCLYYNGSGLSKRGPLATAYNILYNLWFIVLLALFLFYENLRLRYDRKIHSAAVAGMAQSWIGVSFQSDEMHLSLICNFQVEFMTKGVELQLIIAAVALFLVAFINLSFGLPATHSHRQSLFAFLIAKPDHYSIPIASKSYAVPQKKGKLFMAPASEVVQVLNEGIEEENRLVGRPPREAYAMKISKYNVPLPDLEPYDNVPPHLLNPGFFADKGVDDLEKEFGKVPKRIKDQVVGGLDPFEATVAKFGVEATRNRMWRNLAENVKGNPMYLPGAAWGMGGMGPFGAMGPMGPMGGMAGMGVPLMPGVPGMPGMGGFGPGYLSGPVTRPKRAYTRKK